MKPKLLLLLIGAVMAILVCGQAQVQTGAQADNLTGTVPDARLSANVAKLASDQVFSGSNFFTGPFVVSNNAPNSVFSTNVVGLGTSNYFSGNIAVINGIASYRSNALPSKAITFPASDATWTNTTANTASPAMSVNLFIDNSGVTGTTVSKNGQQIYSSLLGDMLIPMKPGDYFSVHYSVGTPTARWEPQ